MEKNNEQKTIENSDVDPQNGHHEMDKIPEFQDKNIGKKIAKATGALVIVQLFLRLFGIIEKMVFAYVFGSSAKTDAYFLARKITSPIMALGDQVIMHSFLPAFVEKLENEGEEKAWKLASTIINLMIILMVIIGILGLVFTQQFLTVFLGKNWQANGIDIALTIRLAKIFLIAMTFLATSSVTYCLLNSYKQFALPASADLVLKATTLIVGVALNGKIGIIAFVIGFIVGAAGKLLTQVIGLKIIKMKDSGISYSPKIDLKDPGFKKFLFLAIPLLIGWAFSTMRTILEFGFLARTGEGSATSYEFAKTICDIPVTFFPYVFGIALFPFLTDIATRGEKSKLRDMLTTATKIMLLIFIPLALAVFLFRVQIISILFASDNFTQAAVDMTSNMLAVFAFVMIVGSLEIIVNQFFFASRDTLRPTATGICLLPVYAAIGYLTVVHLGLGAVGVALALLTYRFLKVTALYTMVRAKVDGLLLKPFIALLAKMLIALVPFILICYFTIGFVDMSVHASGIKQKLLLLMPCLLGGGLAFVIYFITLYLLKIDELSFIANKIKRRK